MERQFREDETAGTRVKADEGEEEESYTLVLPASYVFTFSLPVCNESFNEAVLES